MTLSEGLRGQIIGMHKVGLTNVKISKTLGVPASTVSSTVLRFKKRGTLDVKTSCGRPRLLKERDVRAIVSHIKKDRRTTLSDIVHSSPVKVSRDTIRRTLRREGIFSRVAVVKPFLSDKHKAARLRFAKKYKNWTAAHWKRVVWTDESSFEVGKIYRTVRVWRTKDEKYKACCIAPSFKSGCTSVMV